MTEQVYHLAEVNIALLNAPLTDPTIADFVAGLERINALAETSSGFVWRLQTEDGDATALRVFDNERIIINLSVWQTIDDLFNYAYQSKHTEFFRRRREWFQKLETPPLAMWWIPVGHIPTVEEAKAKLDLLASRGPTALAFTFKQRYTAEQMLLLAAQKMG